MAIRRILVAASGGSASDGAIELACRWSVRLGAGLEGFHVRSDARLALAMAGGDMTIPSPALLEQLDADAGAHAAKTKASFTAITQRHKLPLHATRIPEPADRSPSASWREETGFAPALVAGRARFFDLAVLGRSERVVGESYTQTIEETLAQSGRPILLAPAEPPGTIATVMAVAWNGSPEAVRAVTAALPLLAEAELVSVIMIGDADEARSVASVRDYLSWHGVAAQPRAVAWSASKNMGEALLDTARTAGADLLVMGGYGRNPWREAIFGGATREILALKAMPLLLMH